MPRQASAQTGDRSHFCHPLSRAAHSVVRSLGACKLHDHPRQQIEPGHHALDLGVFLQRVNAAADDAETIERGRAGAGGQAGIGGASTALEGELAPDFAIDGLRPGRELVRKRRCAASAGSRGPARS